jgi:hypothetical protein
MPTNQLWLQSYWQKEEEEEEEEVVVASVSQSNGRNAESLGKPGLFAVRLVARHDLGSIWECAEYCDRSADIKRH